MTLWYCLTCDRHFDTNEQDHADYDRDMCQDCVDKESETRDLPPPKDDRERPQRVVAAGAKVFRENPIMQWARSTRGVV